MISFNCWVWLFFFFLSSFFGFWFLSLHLLTVFNVLCDFLHLRKAVNNTLYDTLFFFFFALSHFLSYISMSSLICLCPLHSLQIPSIPHQTPFPITSSIFLPPHPDAYVSLLFQNHQSSPFLVRKENHLFNVLFW